MKEVSCSEYRSLVDDIGDLDRLPVGAFRHVDHCQPCADFGRELVALRALLREPARVAAPGDFDARLARAIRGRREVRPAKAAWAFPFGTPATAAAAAVLLAAGGALLAGMPGLGVETPEGPPAADAAAAPPARQPEPASRLAAAALPAPPEPSSALATVSASPAEEVRFQPAVHRSAPAKARRSAGLGAGDATLLLSDSAGVRVVSVPRVIVGAQEIVPAAASPVEAGGRVSL